MTPEKTPILGILMGIVIAFFVVLLLAALAAKINEFSHELRYLKREIERTTGSEQMYWKREKRRLWLSLLPCYRRRGR